MDEIALIINMFPYLNTSDHIVILLALLIISFITVGILSFLVPSGAIMLKTGLFSIPILAIILYMNYIPYGVYQAYYIEKEGKVIGANTKESKPFEIDINNEYIQKGTGNKIPFCEHKSNFYIKVYCDELIFITVTKMGTVNFLLGKSIYRAKYNSMMKIKY